jgi:hypothetical protein
MSPPKKSSVRHTRAIQRDRQKRPSLEPPPEEIEKLIEEIVHPATITQVAEYHRRGLRERTLTLPIMVAFLLSLIWRPLGSVREAVRVLNREGLFWTEPISVTPQAVLNRLRNLPSGLFERVFYDVLPRMETRWQQRDRPLPAVIAWAKERYTVVLALDGSTLDALNRSVSLLPKLYHFIHARKRDEADGPVRFLAQEAKLWYRQAETPQISRCASPLDNPTSTLTCL